MKYAVAIDIGGTNTRVALVNGETGDYRQAAVFSQIRKIREETLGKIAEVIKDIIMRS